jgi:endoglucanase
MSKQFSTVTLALIGLMMISTVPWIGQAVSSQTSTNVFEVNKLLARSMNISGLESPVEGAWGVKLEEAFFDQIKAAGFTAVRLPVRFSAHIEPFEPFNIRPEFFRRVDWAIQRAKMRGLAIIIDVHHFDEIKGPEDYLKVRLVDVWRQIANRYKNQPESVIFELYNEPHEGFEPYWNDHMAAALAMVRKTNPTRAVIVGPNGWNNAERFKDLKLPEDPNLILTFHNYTPFQFTHQGADWVGDQSKAWLGTTWTNTPAQQAEIRRYMDFALEYGKAQNKPIFMGEFGAYEKGPIESRAVWTRFTRDEAEARGFSWAYWEYNGGFGIYDPKTKTFRQPLLDALVK